MWGGWRYVLAAAAAACGFDSSTPGGSGDLEPSGGSSGTSTPMTTTAPGTSSSASTSQASTTMDPPPPTMDPSTTGEEESSSTTDGPVPIDIGPYGAAMELPINSGEGDDDPTLRGDMLEIYWSSFRGGSTGDIYRATRENLGDDFANIQRMDTISDGLVEDATPELSHDGLTMVFASPRDGALLDLWMTKRSDPDALDWGTPVRVENVSDPADADLGFVQTEDNLEAFFCRRNNPTTYSDILRATRLDLASNWGNVTTVSSLDDGGLECDPWIDAHGTTIVYDAGTPGLDTDLYWARREGDEFGDPPARAVWREHGLAAEYDPWVSPDAEVIVFTRVVDGVSTDLLGRARRLI